MKIIKEVIKTPWKGVNELLMFLMHPFAMLYLRINMVNIGLGSKFYGMPKIFHHKGSKIIIGDFFENRNSWYTNPLGVNHPTIFATWSAVARIEIGNNVGISGGSIVSNEKIKIGDGTIIGANCTIIDTDFHPVDSENRRYDKNNIKTRPVIIGNNVFIGMNSVILKGVNIPDNAVIPAGSVVRKYEKQNYS